MGADGELSREGKTRASSQTLTDPHRVLSDAIELDPDASEGEVKRDNLYLAKVNNVVSYGVFVGLTPSYGSDITGLVHESNLPPSTEPGEYEPGNRMVVEFVKRKDDGDLAFRGVYSPDADASGPDMVDIQRSLADIREELETLPDTLGDSGSMDPDGEGPLMCQGIPTAASELKRLHASGYSSESLAIESREGGDVVEMTLTVSKYGDTDE